MSSELSFPDCPARFRQADLDRLLTWAAAQEISDVHLQSLCPVYVNQYRSLQPVTRRPLEHFEVHALANALCGEHATATVAGGLDYDTAYAIRPGRGELLRHRINVTACTVHNQPGLHITIRLIPHTPPPLAAQHLPPDLNDWLLETHQGLVLVTGPTGSGKTTLLASTLAAIAADPARTDVILTYESPIEYVFDRVPKVNAVIVQSEIGTHIPSWAAGVRNSLRRAPHLILVGECRDLETMAATLEACLTGHGVFTTLHTSGVPETVGRIARLFPAAERHPIQADLVDALHLVLSQRLVPSVDGRRVPLREYLRFNAPIRQALYDVEPPLLARATRQLLPEYGHTFLQDAREKRAQGLIADEVYRQIARAYGEEENR